MDAWSFQEAEECARSCYDFTEVEVTNCLTPLYEKFGGIIRCIIKRPGANKDLEAWISNHLEEGIHKRIRSLKDYRTLCEVLTVEEQSSGSQRSYVLVHILVQGDKHVGPLIDTDEVCGSTYIRNQLIERMEKILDRDQIENFFYLAGSGGRATAFTGQLFQPLAQRILCRPEFRGEEEKAITYLGTSKPAVIDDQQNPQENRQNAPVKILHLNRGMHVVECTTAEQVVTALKGDALVAPEVGGNEENAPDVPENRLVVGLNESLPVTDFLAKTYGSVTGKFDLLQSTVAKAHVLTEYGLIDLKERYLPDSEAGNIVLRVYFCVPPFRFRKPASKTKSSLHIEKQPIQKSQRDTTKVKCAQGLVIHQFALEVNPGLLARKHHTHDE